MLYVLLSSYSIYMYAVALMAAYVNVGLLLLVCTVQFYAHLKFNIILIWQTVSALLQLILLGLLCPRTLYVDKLFVVSLHGPALVFNPTLQACCFAILMCLATNNVMTIAILFLHRLLVILGKKVTSWGVGVFLVIGMLLYVPVAILLMRTEDWEDCPPEILQYNNITEGVKLRAYNTTTSNGSYVMAVTMYSPPIVFVFACGVILVAYRLLTKLTISEANMKMHKRILQAFFVQATIPFSTGIIVFAWYSVHKKVFQDFPCFECVLFGVVPPILGFQALIHITSIDRYRREFNYWLCIGIVVFTAGMSTVLICTIQF